MKWHQFIFAILSMVAVTSTAQAQLMDFEDIADGVNGIKLDKITPTSDALWVNQSVGDINSFTKNTGALKNHITSGSTIAYQINCTGYFKSLSYQSFDFTSAQMGAVWNNGLTVNVTAYRKGGIVGTKKITLDTTGPQLVTFNFKNIDKVYFVSSGGKFDTSLGKASQSVGALGIGSDTYAFAMDDMVFSPVAAVPEASTYAMMIAGLGMIGLVVRKRRQS